MIDGHLLSRAALDVLLRHRYTLVLWNAVPHDWEDPEGWIDTALRKLAGLPHAVLVLHDIPTGAMAHLDTFLARALDLGARFVQHFPEECTPMVRGVARASLDRYLD